MVSPESMLITRFLFSFVVVICVPLYYTNRTAVSDPSYAQFARKNKKASGGSPTPRCHRTSVPRNLRSCFPTRILIPAPFLFPRMVERNADHVNKSADHNNRYDTHVTTPSVSNLRKNVDTENMSPVKRPR